MPNVNYGKIVQENSEQCLKAWADLQGDSAYTMILFRCVYTCSLPGVRYGSLDVGGATLEINLANNLRVRIHLAFDKRQP